MEKTRWARLLVGLAICAQAHAQSTVAVPSTGISKPPGLIGNDLDFDANRKVTSSTIEGETKAGPAPIVKVLPGGWVTPDANTGWIAPDSTQGFRHLFLRHRWATRED